MINKEQIQNNYPRYILVLFLNWLLFTNIPFLGSFRKYYLAIEIISIIPLFFINKLPLKQSLESNTFFISFVVLTLLSALITKSLLDINLLTTIILLLCIYIFIDSSNKNEIKKLISNIYTSLNIITIISFIGIVLVLLTDIEDSNNELISYSMGNFVHGSRFYGITNNCNTLGPIAAFAAYISIFKIKNNKCNKKKLILHLAIFLMNIFIVGGTGSLTAQISFICGLIVYPICNINKHRKLALLIMIALAILFIFLYITNIDYLSIVLDKDLRTATARTEVWQYSIQIMKNKPLLGYGTFENYQSYAAENNIPMHIAGSHNQYLEIALLYGIPAMILYILSLLLTIFRILKFYLTNKKLNGEIMHLSIIILIYCIVNSFMETQMIFTHNPNMVIFLIFFIVLNKELKHEKSIINHS